MSFDATRWAWGQRTGRLAAKLVLLAIAASEKEKGAYLREIVEATELTEVTARKALKSLLRAGLISCTQDYYINKSTGIKWYRVRGPDNE